MAAHGGRFSLNHIFWTVLMTGLALFILVRVPGVRAMIGF